MEELEAGAVPASQAAESDGQVEQQGATSTPTEAVTPVEQAAESVDGKNDEQNPDKGTHQTTFEERVTQLAEKRAAEIAEQKSAEFQRQFEQRWQESQRLQPLDMQAVNANIATMVEAIDEAKLDGNMLRALDIEDQLRDYRAKVKQYEEGYSESERRREQEQRQQADFHTRLNRISDAAEFYREQQQITPEAWKTAGDWLVKEFETKPLVARKFIEAATTRGETFAIEWAHQYVTEHMGRAAEADKQAKEAAKSAAQLGGDAMEQAAPIKSWDDLMKRPGSEINEFYRKYPKQYAQMKQKKFAT